jgi:hypothetical protein
VTALGSTLRLLWHGPRTVVTVATVLVNLAVVVLLGSFASVVVDQDRHVLSGYTECAAALVQAHGLLADEGADVDLGEPTFVGDNTLRMPFSWEAARDGVPRSGLVTCRFHPTRDDKGKLSTRVVVVEVTR